MIRRSNIARQTFVVYVVALSEAERSTAAKTDFQEIELSARKLKSFEN